MKTQNQKRFEAKLKLIKNRLGYLEAQYKQEMFGVSEGCILSLQSDLTLLYGIMLSVQDDKVRKGSKT